MSNLKNRLRRLEERKSPPQPINVGLAFTFHRVDAVRKLNLVDGEQIVVDWYREWNGIASGRERITKDPEDQGRRCKPGGYLLDVLQQLHQACEFRAKGGSCQDCLGTPVAGEGGQESNPPHKL